MLKRVAATTRHGLCALVLLGCSPRRTGEGMAAPDAAVATPGRPRSPWDLPMAEVWPATRAWNEEEERGYSRFVAQLATGVAAGRCHTLGDCLRDRASNPLLDGTPPATAPPRGSPVDEADCADLAYLLRATWAFARRLPFTYSSRALGEGSDERFLVGAQSGPPRRWDASRAPSELARSVRDTVHSGMLRTAAGEEESDFYPLAVKRGNIRPGDVFYDPGGHVMVVSEVRDDGAVYFIDGHPDRSLTWGRFPASMVPGPPELGGGFKRFRPFTLVGTAVSRARNATLASRDGGEQWSRSAWRIAGHPVTYFDWVRSRLAQPGVRPDPVGEVRERLGWLCRQLRSRAEVVQGALAAGLPHSPHPPSLPENIYATGGDWERWATPARDARLRAEVVALREFVRALPPPPRAGRRALRASLSSAFAESAESDACRITYRDSQGALLPLSLDAVLDRLFDLSFDPWDCPEHRWGAPPGSAEERRCATGADTFHFYDLERRLRNRIERGWGEPTPPGAGPEHPPLADFRPLLRPVVRPVSRALARH